MHLDANDRGVTAGITNTRLNAMKRGIAVETALRLAVATQREVCLVGADPTDRDVQRRLPQLLATGKYRRMGVRHGPYEIEVIRLFERRLTIVTMADRAMVEPVLTRLQQEFRHVVIDAPSRVGNGVGIARVLLPFLDGLVVASDVRAGELAITQSYVERLREIPATRGVEVGVILTGAPPPGGLAPAQVERKLRALPVLGRADAADQSIDALVAWIMHLRSSRPAHAAPAASGT